MKGIILAAGRGTRMAPLSDCMPKALLPLYNKPLIYYPLSMLITAGVREILLITTPEEQPLFRKLLGDGSRFGVSFSYAVQSVPRGMAEAFLIGKEFIENKPVFLSVADNLFYDPTGQLNDHLEKLETRQKGAMVFALQVEDPRPFGVAVFDQKGRIIAIEEKPVRPKSNYIIPGIYCFDDNVSKIAAQVEPSARGELEITSIQNSYLAQGLLEVCKLPPGLIWMDVGSPEALAEATLVLRNLKRKNGIEVGSPEEAAYQRGFISKEQLRQAGESMQKTAYGQHLLSLSKERSFVLL